MAKIAGLMALGQGLTAAGEGIDRAFQYRMEQMRQQSLERLESRRLDIAESSAKSQNAYYDSQVKAGLRGDQMKMMERFSQEMDEMRDRAPDQQILKSVETSLTELAKQAAQGGFADPEMMEEAVVGVFAQAAAAQELYSGSKEDIEARQKWLRDAERLVRRSHSQWNSVFGDEKPMSLLDFAAALGAPAGTNFGEAPAGEGLMSGFAAATVEPEAEGILDRARARQGEAPPPEPGMLQGGVDALPSSPLGLGYAVGKTAAQGLMNMASQPAGPQDELSSLRRQAVGKGLRSNYMLAPLSNAGMFGLPENQMPVPGPLNPDDPLQYAVDR